MLDFLMPEKHAISILKKDHETVKELFDKFEKADSAAEKETIIRKAVTELKIHAAIEEEIFYPTVRKHVGTGVMNEADEEHHVARVLIAELDIVGRGNDHRGAKFHVLLENVRHHIKMEEDGMLPKAKELDIDFKALGRKMLERKKELKQHGIPKDAEHAMPPPLKARAIHPPPAPGKPRRRRRRQPIKTGAARSRSAMSGNSHASH